MARAASRSLALLLASALALAMMARCCCASQGPDAHTVVVQSGEELARGVAAAAASDRPLSVAWTIEVASCSLSAGPSVWLSLPGLPLALARNLTVQPQAGFACRPVLDFGYAFGERASQRLEVVVLPGRIKGTQHARSSSSSCLARRGHQACAGRVAHPAERRGLQGAHRVLSAHGKSWFRGGRGSITP